MNKELNTQDRQYLMDMFSNTNKRVSTIWSKYAQHNTALRDPHITKLLDGVSMLQAYDQFSQHHRLQSILLSTLQNLYDFQFYHPEVYKLSLTAHKNIYINSSEIVQAEDFLQSIHGSYVADTSILNAETVNIDNIWYIKISMNCHSALDNITMYTNNKIINSIFHNKMESRIVKIMCNNKFYHAKITIPINETDLFKYCAHPEIYNFFHISDIGSVANTKIDIYLPLDNYSPVSKDDFEINCVWVSNSFIHNASPTFITSSKPYPIVVPKYLNILQVINVYKDNQILESARNKYDGWYISVVNNQWFINITNTHDHGLINIELLVSSDNNKCNTSRIFFQKFYPVEIKYMGIYKQSISFLNNINTSNILKWIHNSNHHTIDNLFSTFQLFEAYKSMYYKIIKIEPKVVIKKQYSKTFTRVAKTVYINSSLKDKIAQKLFLNELQRQDNTMETIIWR